MKKYIKLLFIVIVGFMLVPMVNAADLPREGVTYFMQYPDGSERTTQNYNEASNPGEELIYSGVTDENGNVPLCGWNNSGKLRIVQHVPNGYTTNEKEIVVDLSDMTKASFIDYRGLSNPKTGRTLLVLLGIIGVISITILVSRKDKKSLFVIPVVLTLAVVTTVEADAVCPCIKVKDGAGKPLAGVKVDVYAKPTNVEAAPAIKFDANGGKFFDGTTEMYYRLPSSPCSYDAFVSSLSDSERSVLFDNINLAYRDQYRPAGADELETFKNGDVIKLNWAADNDANLVVVDGNDGFINFGGKQIDKITTYDKSYYIEDVSNRFKNKNYYNIGYDVNPSCSNYSEYGTKGNGYKKEINYKVNGTYYVCWNNKPDGIYVNDVLFQGNDETCYNEGHFEPESDTSFRLYSREGYILTIRDIENEDINFSLVYEGSGNIFRDGQLPGEETIIVARNQLLSRGDMAMEIRSIEVVKNGRTVAKYLADDLEKDGVYYILNDDTIYDVIDYMQGMFENECFGEEDN